MPVVRCQRATPGVPPDSKFNTIPSGSSTKARMLLTVLHSGLPADYFAPAALICSRRLVRHPHLYMR